MKSFLTVLLASVTTLAASAQVFRPEIINGAILGSVAGAIIGNNSGHGNGGQGALIGAAAGAVLGGMVSEANHGQNWGSTQVAVPRRVYHPVSDRGYDRDGRVLPGVILGGVTGAIIGNNSGRRNGARGAVIGAVAGGLLGVIADENQRVYGPARRVRYPARAETQVVYVDGPSAPVSTAPQSVTIINNYYATPAAASTGCNALFGR